MNAKNFLEKRYNEEMELDDAVHTALLTLREGFEGCVNVQLWLVVCLRCSSVRSGVLGAG